MLRSLACTLCAASLSLHLTAAPVILPGGIQNAASYQSAALPANAPPDVYMPFTGIAPGSLFLVRGTGLGPAVPAGGALPYPNRLPDVPNGTQVLVRSLDTEAEHSAWLLYTSDTQVNAILPSSVPAGPAEVIVSYGGESSEPLAIRVLPSAPGLFTIAQNGLGSGVIQNYESPASQPLNQLTRPARPGRYIILWGTGLGAIDLPDNVPPPAGALAPDLIVRIADVELRPDYAGRAPGYPGVDQINVRLPGDGSIGEGCYLPVQLLRGDAASRPVYLSVAETGEHCRHPFELSSEQLARLDAGEPISTAYLGFSTSYMDFPPRNYLSTSFLLRYPWQLYGERNPVSAHIFNPQATGCSYGGGEVISGRLGTTPPAGTPPPERPRLGIDAGEPLRLDGPGGRTLALVKSDDFEWYGIYHPDTAGQTVPDDFNSGGEWTLHSMGGSDIPAFSSSFTLPPPVRGDAPESIDRAQDLVLTWDPAAGLGAVVMEIEILAFHPAGEDPNRRRYDLVRCSAPFDAGAITIRSVYLNHLSSTADGIIEYSPRLGIPNPVRFTIPGIDYAALTQSTRTSYTIEIR